MKKLINLHYYQNVRSPNRLAGIGNQNAELRRAVPLFEATFSSPDVDGFQQATSMDVYLGPWLQELTCNF